MAIKIAVCDDEFTARAQIVEFLKRFEKDTGERVQVDCFSSAEELLSGMERDVQILLLDIKMQGITGVDAARKLRERCSQVCVIFITSQIQYALDGYKVHAFGFLEKPLQYPLFRRELEEAVRECVRKGGRTIILKNVASVDVLYTNDIIFAEILRRELKVHMMQESRSYTVPLKELEQMLTGYGFFRCHNSYLVNYRHITHIGPDEVTMSGGQVVPISKYRRREFLAGFAAYVGNHG